MASFLPSFSRHDRYATQTVTVLLTGNKVVDNRGGAHIEYASYQPSVLSVAKATARQTTTTSELPPYMTPQSPLVCHVLVAGFTFQIHPLYSQSL